MIRLPLPLKLGDEVRIIAPSDPLDKTKQTVIIDGFHDLGLKVSFADSCFDSKATPEQKLDDLHSAFSDSNIKAIFAATGGFSANQLLPHINYKLIKSNPKIFAGYSDITVLLNAIHAQTGLVTYHTVNAGGVGDKHGREFTQEHLKKCLFSRQVFDLDVAGEWFNKDYTVKSPKYKRYENDGWWPINPKGIAEGRSVGGNIWCLSLLSGTKYFPKFKKDSILLLEDDYESQSHHFATLLRALAQQPNFNKISGIMIGRFQPKSLVTQDFLTQLISSLPGLGSIPVLANVDFGHTKPQVALPVGGIIQLTVLKNRQSVKIIEH